MRNIIYVTKIADGLVLYILFIFFSSQLSEIFNINISCIFVQLNIDIGDNHYS